MLLRDSQSGREGARRVRRYCTANRSLNLFQRVCLCIVPGAPCRKSPWGRTAAAFLCASDYRKRLPPWGALPAWVFRARPAKRALPFADVGRGWLSQQLHSNWLALSNRVIASESFVHAKPSGGADRKRRWFFTRLCTCGPFVR